jgi:hypothetical protein
VKPSAELLRCAVAQELLTSQLLLARTLGGANWWNPNFEGLPSEAWTRHFNVIAASTRPAAVPAAMTACVRAYVLADSGNKKCGQRFANPRSAEDTTFLNDVAKAMADALKSCGEAARALR